MADIVLLSARYSGMPNSQRDQRLPEQANNLFACSPECPASPERGEWFCELARHHEVSLLLWIVDILSLSSSLWSVHGQRRCRCMSKARALCIDTQLKWLCGHSPRLCSFRPHSQIVLTPHIYLVHIQPPSPPRPHCVLSSLISTFHSNTSIKHRNKRKKKAHQYKTHAAHTPHQPPSSVSTSPLPSPASSPFPL